MVFWYLWQAFSQLTSAVKIQSTIDTPALDRDEFRRPDMHGKANSWSGGDNPKSTCWKGAGSDVSEFPQVIRDLDESTSLAKTQDLTPGIRKDNEDQEPNQSISVDRSSKGPGARLEDTNSNGDGPDNNDQRPSHAKGKETKLKRLHWRNIITRATVADKRRELREARLQMARADEGLMKIIREMRIHQSQPKYENFLVLEEHYGRVQATRDSYGSLEESYNALEERLDREEYEVTQLEEPPEDDSNASETHSEDSDASSFVSDGNESGGFAFVGNSESVVYDEYLSRLSDANMIREDLAELRFVHKNLERVQASRQRVGRELSQEDQAIWENFFTKEAALDEKLQKVLAEVKRLKTECVQAGLLGESEDDDGDEEENRNVDILSGSSISEYERYPLLLEQPNEEKVDETSVSLISDFNPRDRGDRIARWLLHKLRSSCGEVELLARISASNDLEPPANTKKWQEEVLDFWFFDSTILPPSAYQVQVPVTEYDLPTSPFSDKDNVSLFQSGQAQLIHLVIRSSSVIDKMDFALLLRLTIPKGEAAQSVR